jgi:hypothetical protein
MVDPKMLELTVYEDILTCWCQWSPILKGRRGFLGNG